MKEARAMLYSQLKHMVDIIFQFTVADFAKWQQLEYVSALLNIIMIECSNLGIKIFIDISGQNK